MIDHDRLFKELLTTFFPDFIDLFFPDVAAYLERDSVTFLDKEIFTDVTAGEEYEADLVAKARFQGQESFFLIHTEHQSEARGYFSKRMFRYFARLYEKHALPVYPIALFSYDVPQRPEPTFHRVDFPDFKVLEFNYRVIQLNRLNWRDFLRYQNPAASALMAKMKIAPCDRLRVKSECLRLMATLKLDRARMRLISGFIDTYLRLNAEEERLFQTEISTIEPSAREVVMEIVTSWMEQGLEQGLEQGRQREALSLILRQLNRRLGGIAPDLGAKIRSLSVDKLEELGEELLDFSDVADLVTWLDREIIG
ncbi:Rpn family recombination-promoting nuclease/putative transposase [Argonema antarcticum]|uniref:Rpn family recombination-promoting nuclease/putative transposase n=1 Tax=Argonema antarcticum TaxID=2942763 RepID=UPI0020136402|nr:Rpn family recombination-promoting nuclease/putative transposase [Argonema antarcticum]MCL1474823.1 Rpn family recombination-promoting nuclease/putative transposase [Argonema antarcticum A004/B2]